MKQCCEYLRGLRYNIRMMSILVEITYFVYRDNKSVFWNAILPEYILGVILLGKESVMISVEQPMLTIMTVWKIYLRSIFPGIRKCVWLCTIYTWRGNIIVCDKNHWDF